MNPKHRQILRKLHAATKNGRLLWIKAAPEHYVASGSITVSVRLLTPILAGDPETEGPQAFQVNIDNVTMTFWDGTVGASVVREILSAGLKEWRTHAKLIESNMERVLRGFIETKR